jgi:hypothetical protein
VFDAQLDSSKHDVIVQIITNHDATTAIQEEQEVEIAKETKNMLTLILQI